MMQTSTTPDQSQLIKSANPELSKVLSEPSNTIPKDRGWMCRLNCSCVHIP